MNFPPTLRSSAGPGERRSASARWLTPAFLPALLVLLGAQALIYGLVAR